MKLTTRRVLLGVGLITFGALRSDGDKRKEAPP